MKKNFLKNLLLVFIACFMIVGVKVHASDLKEKREEIEVEILVNSVGDDFAENIVFEDGTKLSDYEYSVKYLPMTRSYTIANYFNYAAWITRNGVVSLSVDPKENVRSFTAEKDKAWSVLSSKTRGFGSHSNWDNTKVMGWQFDCHFWFAGSKSYWNLEPHRTAGSYAAVVAAGCNP